MKLNFLKNRVQRYEKASNIQKENGFFYSIPLAFYSLISTFAAQIIINYESKNDFIGHHAGLESALECADNSF